MPLNDDAAQESMRAAVLNDYIGAAGLVVQDDPRPVPGAGEVLIEVAATPINPSDLAFLEGNYSPRPSLPTRAGLEGSGTVVAAGPGTLGDEVSFEAGAMSVVNPLTAPAFLEIAKSGDHKGVISTAAAGALGRMVDRFLRGDGIKVINVVRRSDQARSLTDSGAEIALDSSSCDFDSELRQACASLDARLAFDAVGGVLRRRLLSAMPPGSTVMVYGGLAKQPSHADIGDLVFEGKTVAGFWLTRWLPQKNPLQSLWLWRKVQRLIGGELSSEIRDTYPLESIGDAVSS